MSRPSALSVRANVGFTEAMILLVLIIYSFSILFTDAVLQNEHTFKEVPLGELKWEEALFFFGGIFDSYNTLFRTAVTD